MRTYDQTNVIELPQQPNHRVAKIELDNGVSFAVNEGDLPLLIGRGADCDISIPSGHVSRHDCELFLQNQALCLRDVSTNGTVVGGRSIVGESVSLKGRTPVLFAGEAMITIVASGINDSRKSQDLRSERRAQDRRVSERRANVCKVDFERRSDARRCLQRRAAQS